MQNIVPLADTSGWMIDDDELQESLQKPLTPVQIELLISLGRLIAGVAWVADGIRAAWRMLPLKK